MTGHDVIVVGGGLAGLSCAVRLHESGRAVHLVEASDQVGGRVRTDKLDGFLLDRGFQVMLDAYPIAGEMLDLEALDLRPYLPGALIRKDERFFRLMDVFRHPLALGETVLQPIGTLRDKLLVGRLRLSLLTASEESIWRNFAEEPTESFLRRYGFSEDFIDAFFRGFYGGIFLERELVTSARFFAFTFRLFGKGKATLPNRGMEEIPRQLAARLPPDAIRCGSAVENIEDDGTLRLRDGSPQRAAELVIATDGATAHHLLPEIAPPTWQSTVNLYFRAKEPPLSEPIIALAGYRTGLVHNVSVPNLVAPGYAAGRDALVSVSVLGSVAQAESGEFLRAVRSELGEWFGPAASDWEHLRSYPIARALPSPVAGHDRSGFHHPRPGIRVCGDHCLSGSIEGAIRSGLAAAEDILSSSHDRR